MSFRRAHYRAAGDDQYQSRLPITRGTFFKDRYLRINLAKIWGEWTIDTASAPSCIRKRPVVIAGHSTSITLENAFWDRLKVIAARDGELLKSLFTRIDAERMGNLASALRVFVLKVLYPKA